MRNIGHKNTIN